MRRASSHTVEAGIRGKSATSLAVITSSRVTPRATSVSASGRRRVESQLLPNACG